MRIFGHNIYGAPIDNATRCRHYHSEHDIVAIKFACCGHYYPCYRCHDDHPIKRWQPAQFDQQAVLCGACGHALTIREYLHCNARCPACHAAFNARCHHHHDIYFACHGTC